MDRDPSSGASRHLLPQGEKGRSATSYLNFKQHAFAFSRRSAPEACISFTLFENRGRRESRVPIAPAVERTKRTRDHRATGSSGFPRATVYGLFRAHPGETMLCCHRRLADSRCIPPGWADTSPQDLTPAFGASGRHDFAVRGCLAKGLAGPRAIRKVSAKTVLSAVRSRAG